MTRRYFYVVEYSINEVKFYVENPYRYADESTAYEFLGKCIHDIVLSNPGVVLTKANVSFEYEK